MSDEVQVDTRDRVAFATINRPHRSNALDAKANRRLFEVLEWADGDPDVVAIVIQGAGRKAFCAGADINALSTGGDARGTSERISFGGGLTGVGGRRLVVSKPTVAVVRGWALGGGFELAAACDIVLADETARFGIPEARAGILGDSLAVHRAMRHLPHHVALDLILTGRVMDAQEALRLGLISGVSPPDELDALVADRLDRIRASSPVAIRISKEVALRGLEYPLDAAVSMTYEAVESYVASLDYAEAMAAIRERRDPVWST